MLQIPRRNFARSIKNNNVGLNELADWIEASALLCDSIVSKSDVVDVLLEESICEKQDMAWRIVADGWAEVARRKSQGEIPGEFRVEADRIVDYDNWHQDPVRAFLLTLSIFRIFPDWAMEVRDSPRQGELFEKVVEKLLLSLFSGWDCYRVGWSPATKGNLHDVIKEVGARLNCGCHPNLDFWVPDHGKDGGLDLVFYRSFPDDKQGFPSYFIQCASGSNWRRKVSTPSSNTWQKWLDGALLPGTGIAAPFVIDDKVLSGAALEGQVVVMDRLRLLSCYYRSREQVDPDLLRQIVDWTEELAQTLPMLE